MTHRKSLAALVSVTAILTVAACGDSGGGGSTPDAGQDALVPVDAADDTAVGPTDSVIGQPGDAPGDAGAASPDAEVTQPVPDAAGQGEDAEPATPDVSDPSPDTEPAGPDSGGADVIGDVVEPGSDAIGEDAAPGDIVADSAVGDAATDDVTCIPSCEGKTCGSDGCEGICGTCGDGQTCDLAGVCLVASQGDTCADPIIISAPGWSANGDTTGAPNSFAYGSGACAGVFSGFGAGSGDHVYAFTSPVTGVFTVELDADFDSTLYVAELCEDVDNSCLGADDAVGPGIESVTFAAVEGLTYYVFVDGWDNSSDVSGTYTISLSEPCLPQCTGKACGADGCGGVCGTCGSGLVCDEALFTCVLNPACEEAIEVPSAPWSVEGDTTESSNDFFYSDLACAGEDTGFGAGSNDDVYTFTAEAGGVYTFSVDATFDSVTYVASDCYDVDGSCQGANDAIGAGLEEVLVLLQAGQTVFVYVDGWQNGDNVAGPYTFSVSAPCLPQCLDSDCGDDGCGSTCGVCDDGQLCSLTGQCVEGADLPTNTCTIPGEVGDAPWSATGSTGDATNDFSVGGEVCPGDESTLGLGGASDDNVWRFEAPLDAVYRVWLKADDFDSALIVTTDCAQPDAGCIGAMDEGYAAEEEVFVSAAAGEVYWIIVDGWSNSSNLNGTYTVGIDSPCFPSCGGKSCGGDGCGASCGTCSAGEGCDVDGLCVPVDDLPGNTCADPIALGPAPTTFSGETVNATGDFTFEDGACPGEYVGQGSACKDRVHAFTAEMAGVYTFELEGTFDSLLVVASICEDIDNSCLGAHDTIGVETVVATLAEGETVYVVDDGWSDYDNLEGDYTLSVAAPCIPSCDGKACGDNGCGTSCGACVDGEFCSEVGQCVDSSTIPGNYCGSPFIIDAVPFAGVGDTTIATNDFHVSDGVCQTGSTTGKGAGSADHVWMFSPVVPGTYTIALQPDQGFDTALYVLTSCVDPDGSCVGVDDVVSNPEELVVNIGAGETVFIIVDGWSNTQNLQGAYTLTVSEPCSPTCDGKECGPDGCGAFCGFCAAGDLCEEQGTCLEATSLPGNTCDNPFTVDTVPFTATGDTQVASNLVGFGAGACPGASTAKGSGSNDHLYRFEPPQDGVYTVDIDTQFDAVLYVLSDCTDPDSSCLGASDVAFTTGVETVTFSGSVGQVYWIVVDGWSTSTNLAGEYVLTVSAPCTPQCGGKQCGPDGCGATCGACPGSDECDTETGQCLGCAPQCDGKQCGPDGCGSTCGTCSDGTGCVNNPGVAEFGTCQPGALCGHADQCTYDSSAMCQCDTGCFGESYQDCCDDVCLVCPESGGEDVECVWPPAP